LLETPRFDVYLLELLVLEPKLAHKCLYAMLTFLFICRRARSEFPVSVPPVLWVSSTFVFTLWCKLKI
jgi:hypothetical protein